MQQAVSRTLGLFCSAPRDLGLQVQVDALPALSQDPLRCLLLGGARSGKTSLAFHFAYQLAAAGHTVLVFCRRIKLEASPFLLPEGITAHHAAFQRIKLKYIYSLQDIYCYASCMHLAEDRPAAVVVDDISEIMHASRTLDRRQRDALLLKTLTCLADGLDHWRDACGHPCELLITDSTTADGNAPQQYIITRVCPLVLRVTGSPPAALTLSVDPLSADLMPTAASAVTLHLSLTHTHIRLEGVAT